jgi:SSS family solute:Na+ symporter
VELNYLDIGIFVVFIGFVASFSMYKSRKEKTGKDFFLAGRGLTWPLIGFSLIAANISTEQFVGMNGAAAGEVGLAIASYDWIAAVSLVLVAIFFLPFLLRGGIYTIPQYLEYRYNNAARAIMAVITMFVYVLVTISMVAYSGGLTLQTIFGDIENPRHLLYGIIAIASISTLYATWGGLKAVAWADLFQCSALLIGGFCVTIACVIAVGKTDGGMAAFIEQSSDKLHVALPKTHSSLPVSALFFGIWIPNLYYWGFNQYIVQRTLAAKSLKDGQFGVLLAAFMQVILPLIIVLPGIMAMYLFRDQLQSRPDAAFPFLIRELIPMGLKGFIFAAIAGAVISSLASMLNSASTIFTIDIYQRYFNPNPSQKRLIWTGRFTTLIFVIIGSFIGYFLRYFPSGIFNFIQEFQGFLSPGVLGAFVFGFILKKAPPLAGVAALVVNFITYAILLVFFSGYELLASVTIVPVPFLNRMAISFAVVALTMVIITVLKPLKEPVKMPVNDDIDMKPAPSVIWIGIAITVAVIALYIIFW